MEIEKNMAELLEAKDISLSFGNKTVLKNASFSLLPGGLMIIGGPSGSGKSTLLRILNRLQDPDSGEIKFHGKLLYEYEVIDLRRRICYLQQTPFMIRGTVRDNLLLPFHFQSAAEATLPSEEVLLDLIRQFQLTDISLADNAANLSVGQKQRLSFIRVLLLAPDVLLLDEPTSALDPESKSIVERHIEKLVMESGIGIIMITHLDVFTQHVKARKYRLSEGVLMEILS